MQTLTPEHAVEIFRPTDSFALPLGPCQPSRTVEAMGARTDWDDLRIFGAYIGVFSELFNHPNVHYLSAFFGPVERLLQAAGANIGFTPAGFRMWAPLVEAIAPRVMMASATPPDAEGRCSLSLHAGATVHELHRAAADPDRVVLVETSDAFPRTYGFGEHTHSLHVDEIDYLVHADAEAVPIPERAATDADGAIAANIAPLIPPGATIQTGIGAVPSIVASMLAEGDGGEYGIHSEMFTTGLMELHRAGKVTNQRKGQFPGVSVTTFAAGTEELYRWLEDNRDVAFLPVDVVNDPAVIGANANMITINGGLAMDIHGQVVADTRAGNQFSGIGGHEDFVTGAGLELSDRSIICLPSTYAVGDALASRIVPYFEAGAVITTPRHHVDVVVTEYGVAELQGKTVRQRGLALAEIAHPDFRDELRAAAERASGGRSPVPPPA